MLNVAALVAGSGGNGPAPAPWTPLDLGADLLAWWDAEYDPLLITETAGAVSSWKDIVGAYDVVQGTGAAQPIYSATSFNGTGGVTFDGTDDELTLVGVPAGLPTGANPCEMWALVDQTQGAATAGFLAILAYGNTGGTSRHVRRATDGSTNRANILVNNNASNTNVDFSGRHVVRGIVGATTSNMNVDSVAGTDLVEVPNTATTRVRIGAQCNTAAAGFWKGVIASVLVTAPLSAGEATQMYGYLNARL
jgi:hypothetical protein